ncbi:malonyl-CoA decarboxylase domain-containing protein [Cupriavidus taiwanensis]|uniref:malonyl-CoA decarboxylase domain-containing protein n=1 Tax=Cupriavidus taiwanensis TaxID=164546 RepID=UPI000E109830|nr:malonyl-CoA decarboxylase family protein [Cupriavidus taiwanensis]SOY49036.1 Malonyl-CoA decarboxylase [Cupriavidus taiwanensis]SOY49163.1 Malonyl-CoA decarboxylase [Cupriavidus taiwanensis]SOY83304.1 Malonyl-CoA decarboxylase [Cupriavidus taiwanensis]SOZ57340.1 Malonyl-CoA decarboxylase [Cupriavidus taiwanensis]SOZ79347.1 Malonyl-CoA decarboxylase [Cupriavidus taiwanensis]
MNSFDTGDQKISAPLGESEPSSSNILSRLGRWWGRKGEGEAKANGVARAATPADDEAPLPARAVRRQREQLRLCFDARLTDGAANAAAQAWQAEYEAAGEATRRGMLAVLAEVAGSGSEDAAAEGDKGARAGQAQSSARIRFFKRLAALHGQRGNSACGLHFLIQLRADMLRWQRRMPGLRPLDDDLEALFSNWFDVGLLELQPITWDSPASLLEKLIRYEAVHEIASWTDLRNRLDSDRRCYAFFHPRIAREPLIFVEVAFAPEMAADVHTLLDEAAPLEDLRRVKWAIFYSISNTQAGLRGVSFGNFLLKRVIEEVQREFPKVKQFATLSPIPGFADWLRKQDGDAVARVLGDKRLARWSERHGNAPADGAAWLEALAPDAADAVVRDTALTLAAHFLVRERNQSMPADPVARFHLGNGACVERLNWGADLSRKGRSQSCGMMVNYLYVPEALDDNLARLGAGNPRISRSVGKLL